MSQFPATYIPGSSFTALAELPILTNGLPGPQLDGEFTRMGLSVNQTIGRLGELQQDDGRLRQSSVNLASLNAEVLAILAAGGVTPRVLTEGEQYSPGDLISNPWDSLTITGSFSPDLPESLPFRGLDDNGFIFFSDAPAFIEDQDFTRVYRIGDRWRIHRWQSGASGPSQGWMSAAGDEASPDIAVSWEPDPDTNIEVTGEPIIGAITRTLGTYLCISQHNTYGGFAFNAPRWALIAAPPQAGILTTDEFTGTGAQTAFVLSVTPITKDNTQVFIDGLYVHKDAYTLSGTTVLFGIAPLNGELIEVISGTPTASTVVTVTDGSITAAKLAANAVTAAAIAAGAVGVDELANLSVTTSKLAAESVTAEKLANFSISPDKLAPNSVTAGKIAAGAVASASLAPNSVTADKIPNSSIPGSKLATGPLALNGEPTAAAHAATKLYVDGAALSAAAAAAAPVSAAKANKAGDTFTGPLVLGTAPLEIPAGTAPVFGARAFAKITPYYSGGLTSAYKVGTFIRDGAGTITVTITAHGLRTGDAIFLDFASGATDGLFSATRLTDNTFTVPQAGGVTASLAVTARLFRIASGKNISSVTTSDGGADHLVCNFTVPMPSADYTTQATVGYLLSAGMSVANEDANLGTQMNTAGQCFIAIHGNTSPRQVNVTAFA